MCASPETSPETAPTSRPPARTIVVGDLARRHSAILGNREERHLMERRRPIEKLKPDHAETRRVLEPEHLDWFAGLPLFIRIPEANAVVVHAGVLPGIAIEAQLPHT